MFLLVMYGVPVSLGRTGLPVPNSVTGSGKSSQPMFGCYGLVAAREEKRQEGEVCITPSQYPTLTLLPPNHSTGC